MIVTFDRIYEVEIHGCNYDFELDEWDEDSHECISQNCYDTYNAAVSAVRSITPESAQEMERWSDRNGLDIAIYERHFVNGEEIEFDLAGEAEWIGLHCDLTGL